ncbi:MAG: fold metallo-hydrolase [Solirubrobacterales bacterium]|jgi:N-acyl homoserine lactone hydrolase|nr:fold metallo-hydrolase [Solirubrobacterales bacterium]
MTSVRRLIPLIVGYERLPKSFSLHGDTSGEMLVEPVPAVLLDTDEGWTLLDTGINTVLIRDAHLYRRTHGRNHDITPILAGGGESLVEEMAVHGVGVEDVTRIYLSHLHNDHAGGLRLFDCKVPVWVQRIEYEYGMGGHPFPEEHGMYRIDFDDPKIPWQLMDGDTELAPGIRAVFTPGHTPGHQSFVIDLPDGGGVILPFDAGDLTENYEREIPPGGFVRCSAEQALEPILALNALAAETGYPIVPGHDPVAWPAFIRSTLGTAVPGPGA